MLSRYYFKYDEPKFCVKINRNLYNDVLNYTFTIRFLFKPFIFMTMYNQSTYAFNVIHRFSSFSF